VVEEECMMRSFIICTLHHILLGWSNQGKRCRHVACMGEVRNSYKILVGKHGGNRLLGRPRHIWENIIKVDLREMGKRVWTEFI
jgi:hypothetical protein